LFVAPAQEVKKDTLHGSLPEYPLLPDSTLFRKSFISPPFRFSKPEELLLTDSALYSIMEKHSFSGFGDKKKAPTPILPWQITPGLNFNIVPSRWELPLMGTTLTFAPTVSYQLSDKMLLYGGASFTQYPNLAYVQNLIAPGWPRRPNITTQAFGGFAYALHERITLHGNVQHSLYNPIPPPLTLFAPAYTTMSVGADVDIWQGLGVTVDRVWDIDPFGRTRQYTRYSPYINVPKFLKFLGL
jgi:hypothetical protein